MQRVSLIEEDKKMTKWYPVRVHFPAGNGLPAEWHEDEIRGNSPESALANARWNWPAADKIELA
jgi:hypothetical protein